MSRKSIVLLLFALACQRREAVNAAAPPAQQAPAAGMSITSSAFADGGALPKQYTCDGTNVNPPLDFHGVPQAAHSLALVMVDPDAPGGAFTHWLLWDIPTTTPGIAEAAKTPPGVAGTNDLGQASYGGPCPPPGPPHHYVFTLYALDKTLALPAQSKRADLERAVSGHVAAQAMLTATYARP
jgi:Raf kinase inhibitor-like YbhB/YbcL family protein